MTPGQVLDGIAQAGVDLDRPVPQLELRRRASFASPSTPCSRRSSGGSTRSGPAAPPEMRRSVENPLRAGLPAGGATRPCAFAIFGATGDLPSASCCRRSTTSACAALLPPRFALVGYARTDMDRRRVPQLCHGGDREPFADADRRALLAGVRLPAALPRPAASTTTTTSTPLGDTSSRVDDERGTEGNRVFYLSTPSKLLPGDRAADGCRQPERPAGLRPGRDREAVRPRPRPAPASWPRSCTSRSEEQQIFRIDHYLGKETVQNIFAFRFANAIFEPIWNNHFVDHVQITVAESIGVEHRGRLLRGDRSRPRHRPEPPAAGAGAGGDGTALVLRGRPGARREDQAAAGRCGRCASRTRFAASTATGYRRRRGGDPLPRGARGRAPTRTRRPSWPRGFEIDNWRWAGTPFYIRAGKRLAKRVTEVAVQFRRPPHLPFHRDAAEHLEPNSLVLRIQPDEGISLRFGAKAPAPTLTIRTVNMDFLYGIAPSCRTCPRRTRR